ncbi:hypothetical protein IF2G_02121 [Cordyceps javanica]|nr:hypothetical protein IF2G_02121 [Cordyceps javanica]
MVRRNFGGKSAARLLQRVFHVDSLALRGVSLTSEDASVTSWITPHRHHRLKSTLPFGSKVFTVPVTCAGTQ